MPKQLILYSTSYCHLCDFAQSLLINYVKAFTLKIIDIADNELLLNQYGMRIPVLQRDDTKAELNWPFDANDIQKFLN
jgi:hypothetical protein